MHLFKNRLKNEKTPKKFELSVLIVIIFIMLIASMVFIPIDVVHPVEAGKYGNLSNLIQPYVVLQGPIAKI
ncbi:MAG: hypothetical protein A7315_05010 [Candidatus Altiarchaeales archaeon WOR_SM1_79]|nr:MAG: hypothetical protein A7315_05010 [Candidatus Altiarchaeales archaeon WOR_SM1_79]